MYMLQNTMSCNWKTFCIIDKKASFESLLWPDFQLMYYLFIWTFECVKPMFGVYAFWTDFETDQVLEYVYLAVLPYFLLIDL